MKNALISIATLVALIVAAGIGNLASKAVVGTRSDPLLEKAELAAREINKALPVMIDRATRLDSTVADRTANSVRVTYHYTLLDLNASNVASIDTGILRAHVLKTTCAQRDANLLAKGMAMGFRYVANDAAIVTSFDVRASDCAQRAVTENAGSASPSSDTRSVVVRDRATGELFERLPDGAYRPYHGKVVPFATGNEVNDVVRANMGSDLTDALDAAARTERKDTRQERTSVPKILACVLDEVPGVQTDQAAQAILGRCKERYGGQSVEKKGGWLARYESPIDCAATEAKATPSKAGVQMIVAACQALYAPN